MIFHKLLYSPPFTLNTTGIVYFLSITNITTGLDLSYTNWQDMQIQVEKSIYRTSDVILYDRAHNTFKTLYSNKSGTDEIIEYSLVDVTNSNIVISGQISCTPKTCSLNEISVTSSNLISNANPSLVVTYTINFTIHYDKIPVSAGYVYLFDTLSFIISATGLDNYLSTGILVNSNDYISTWVVKNSVELLDLNIFNQAPVQIIFKYINIDSSADQTVYTETGDKVILANDNISNNNYNIAYVKGCGSTTHLTLPDSNEVQQIYFELDLFLN